MQRPGQQLVHLAVTRRIQQDRPFALSQARAEIQSDLKGGFPAGFLSTGLALDLHVNLLGLDALVCCDRSQCQYNSTAECSRYQLDRA